MKQEKRALRLGLTPFKLWRLCLEVPETAGKSFQGKLPIPRKPLSLQKSSRVFQPSLDNSAFRIWRVTGFANKRITSCKSLSHSDYWCRHSNCPNRRFEISSHFHFILLGYCGCKNVVAWSATVCYLVSQASQKHENYTIKTVSFSSLLSSKNRPQSRPITPFHSSPAEVATTLSRFGSTAGHNGCHKETPSHGQVRGE